MTRRPRAASDHLDHQEACPAGRAPRATLAVLLTLAALVTLAGCFGGSGRPDRPDQLEGAALTAEINRLSDEIAALPHVTSVGLQYTDNVTNGQTFGGGISTDTNDQSTLDEVLDSVVRILWNTEAFYPDDISTAVVSADRTTYADYRSIGGRARSIGPAEMTERYGQPAFLTGSG